MHHEVKHVEACQQNKKTDFDLWDHFLNHSVFLETKWLVFRTLKLTVSLTTKHLNQLLFYSSIWFDNVQS